MRYRFPQLTRRRFLSGFIKSMAAGAFTVWLPGDRSSGHIPEKGGFISACDDIEDHHYMAGFDFSGGMRFLVETPQRLHAAAHNPARAAQFVFFARRPGNEIYSIDIHSGSVTGRIASRQGRHFSGHGCFSGDGRYLYTVENDYENNQGIVSVRDAATLGVLEEWNTHGPDPHEARLLGGGETLVVANGGILTHPGRPGVNLAPDAMRPSLVYLDTADGKMRGDFRLRDRQLSIRHIDINDKGLVAIALQYEGPAVNRMPLLACHAGEDALQLFADDACDWRYLNRYTGSVKFAGGDIAAVSSPRGNCLSFWNIKQRALTARHYIHDVCGIGYDETRRDFAVTTGAGAVYRFDGHGRMAGDGPEARLRNIRWDNHLTATG